MNWKEYFNFKPRIEESDEEELVDTKIHFRNLYQHRWVWYHLILCIQLIISNILLVAILVTLAIKL